MRNAKIIVVDDNEAVLRSLRTILSHEFKTIVTFLVGSYFGA